MPGGSAHQATPSGSKVASPAEHGDLWILGSRDDSLHNYGDVIQVGTQQPFRFVQERLVDWYTTNTSPHHKPGFFVSHAPRWHSLLHHHVFFQLQAVVISYRSTFTHLFWCLSHRPAAQRQPPKPVPWAPSSSLSAPRPLPRPTGSAAKCPKFDSSPGRPGKKDVGRWRINKLRLELMNFMPSWSWFLSKKSKQPTKSDVFGSLKRR